MGVNIPMQCGTGMSWKDERFRGLNLIVDASRCIVGAALFEHATSENATLLLRPAMKRFGAPASRITARVS